MSYSQIEPPSSSQRSLSSHFAVSSIRARTLSGVSISNLAKVLRCGGNEDSLTLSCEEDPSKLKVKFENISKL